MGASTPSVQERHDESAGETTNAQKGRYPVLEEPLFRLKKEPETLEIELMEQKEAVNMAYANPRGDWPASMTEDVVDPHRIIVDAHHHLWDRPGSRYMLKEFLTDVDDAGHAIAATVYVECRSMDRREGPANRRSIGEVEFASEVAKASEASRDASIRVC